MAVSPRESSPSLRWIKIGLVGRPHGVKGDFFLSGRDSPLDGDFACVRIGSDPGWGDEAKVLMIRHTPGGRTVLRCSRSRSRDEAEALAGRPVWVARDAIEVDPENQYVWGDLIGRPVVDVDGFRVGHVLRVYNAGASDILVVRDERARGLELPVAPTYIDPSSLGPSGQSEDAIRMIVSSSLFADLWQDEIYV